MVLNDSRGEGNAAAATEQQALAAPPPPLADVVAAGPFHGHPPVAMHGAAFSPAPVHGWGPWLAPPAGMMAPVPQPMAIQGMSVAPAGFVPAVHPQFHPRLAWPGVPYGHQRLPPHPHQQPIAGPLPTPPVQQGYPGLQELPRDPWGVADSEGSAAQEQRSGGSSSYADAARGGAQSSGTPASPLGSPSGTHRAPQSSASGRAQASPPPLPMVPPRAAGLPPQAGQAQETVEAQDEAAAGGSRPLRSAAGRKDLERLTMNARNRLAALYRRLPEPALQWLLYRLIASYARISHAALLQRPGSHAAAIRLPLADALGACSSISHLPFPQLAAAAQPLLEDLCARFLSGGDVLAPVARQLEAATGRGSRGIRVLPPLDRAEVETAAFQLAADASLALPQLPAEAALGGRALPPPRPPPARGSIMDLPESLRPLFDGTGDGSGQLKQLLTAALENLPVAIALAQAPAPPGSAQLLLVVSPDIDFGTVCVASLAAADLADAAGAAAAGLPPLPGLSAAAGPTTGSLLDLLHLSAVPHGGRAAPAGDASAAPSPRPAPVLRFRELVVENAGASEPVWLLGGVAAPAFPHTLAALDDASLFWLDGHQAVRLDPRQRHTVTLALSAADCAARRQESGILQQLLLLVCAVARSGLAAAALARIPGAPVADVEWPAGAESADRGGGSGVEERLGPAAAFRLVVVARRVTVALLDRPGDLQTLLDADARPFVAAHLRRLFDEPPADGAVAAIPSSAAALLATGEPHSRSGEAEPPPAYWRKATAAERAAAAARSRSGALGAAPLLQRHARLLALEEAALELDICRYDAWNVRLRLAVFVGGTSGSTTRYRLLSLAPPSHGADAYRAAGGVYRGPAPELLQPGGVEGASAAADDPPVYALGVLDVPGLSEGRPTLLTGDAVHLRTAQRPQRELAARVAATVGSTVFLLLPEAFWRQPDVSPLVPQLRAARRGGFGASGLFDGLLHVRFSFDRLAFGRMQGALAAAAEGQQLAAACWVPRWPQPPSAADEGRDAREVEAHSERMRQLQPTADRVAATEPALRELGSRRLNAEQRHAVAAVVCGAGRAYPFALNGPPGTGKTVTLVECALQLLQAFPLARLLLCAPQNYSADLLCSALAATGLAHSDMLRVNDPRRPPFTVKEDVLPYCLYSDATRMFALPDVAAVASRRVVIATCGAAALLREGEFAVDAATFTHVLIDEAGQALLPEALIPFSLLKPPLAAGAGAGPASDPGWGAVLCGDPRQLGPVVRSQVAAASGLASSLLELCISHHAACAADVMRQGLVPPTAMLVRNYRSHRRLLDLPSTLFYGGSLQAAADPRSVLPPRWRELAADGGKWQEESDGEEAAAAAASAESGAEGGSQEEDPQEEEEEKEEEEGSFDQGSTASLLFYGVRGQQMREGDAPSFFNPLEASTVVELVRGLLASGAGVRPDDCGIMATYRKQVQKIRLLLRERGLGAIRVGTVDDYQGQEERIVFISTTLSRPESLPPQQLQQQGGVGDDTADRNLGFWRNPKRFNVAITRAKALLVVVGHPAVLLEDTSWRELLRHCFSNGAYRGAGADSLRQRFRVDAGAAAPPLPEVPAGEEGALPEAADAELQRAIGQLAELALLGAGRAAELFPDSLDELYAAAADEAPFRVLL